LVGRSGGFQLSRGLSDLGEMASGTQCGEPARRGLLTGESATECIFVLGNPTEDKGQGNSFPCVY
jgi:hypothetical protein